MRCLTLQVCFFSSLWLTAYISEMPGSERTAGSVSIARLMEPEGLSEEELFAPRPEELPIIRNGTVTLIPVEEKQRVLDLLQEVLRFRIELGCLISLLRGDAYLRTRKALGEDFCYVSTQPTEHLANVCLSCYKNLPTSWQHVMV